MKSEYTPQKILIPLDGSEYSKRAVQLAGNLGVYLKENLSGITLLHVTTASYLSRRTGYIDFRVEDLKQSNAFKKLKDQYIEEKIIPFLNEGEKILRDSGIGVRIEKLVVDGDPAEEIVRIANKEKFSTIIMGRKGLSGMKSFFLGSVTVRVAGHASCNVIIVPLDAKIEFRNILIATDGSRYSNAAASQAMNIAKHSGANLIAVSVVPSELLSPLDIVQSEMQRDLINEEEIKEAEKNVKYVKELAEKEGLNVQGFILAGKPYDAIIDTAKKKDVDLIVIGSHGKTGFEKFLVGSVAERVIILSPCAVLVVKMLREI